MTRSEEVNCLERQLSVYLEEYYRESDDDIAEELFRNFAYRIIRAIRRIRLKAMDEEGFFDGEAAVEEG